MAFSEQWLTLREQSDHASRDSQLLAQAIDVAGENPVIVDLGSGTGSTVRALAPFLPENTKWRLVDNDQSLLEVASAELAERATLHPMDIADQDNLPLQDATLVTASALIDLVSRQWLEDFAERVQVPVYFALSYDGVMNWTPNNPLDDSITEAFNNHQRNDKGFGSALGPDSVSVAEEVFKAAGFEVFKAPSPWQLGPEETELQQALVQGIAEAALEAGEQDALAWGENRVNLAYETECFIGHGDILAVPRNSESGAQHASN